LDASDLDESGAFRVVGLLSCARAIDAAVLAERERAKEVIGCAEVLVGNVNRLRTWNTSKPYNENYCRYQLFSAAERCEYAIKAIRAGEGA
jgi:hypothetical protein